MRGRFVCCAVAFANNQASPFHLLIPVGSGVPFFESAQLISRNATACPTSHARSPLDGSSSRQCFGSAIAVFLFLLVIPVLLLNVRRFRREV